LIYFLGILVFVAVLVVSVAWHELGHFIPAKLFGVKVPQFMVGFGPTLFSRKRGETEYGIKWLLLGGYIRMAAMYRPEASPKAAKKGWRARLADEARAVSREELAEMGPDSQGRGFYTLSAPRKAAVMLGGPTMNLILALVLLGVVGSGIGAYQTSTTIEKVAACYDSAGGWTEACDAKTTAGPAAQAGVLPGDTVVSWNGQAIEEWADLGQAIAKSGTAPGVLEVGRVDQTVLLEVTPVVFDQSDQARPVIGVSAGYELAKLPITQAPKELVSVVGASAKVYLSLPVRVWQTLTDMIEGNERDINSPLSMVGVARVSGDMGQISGGDGVDPWRIRWAMWLQLGAMVNIALWMFNMLPLLPLDGGHVVNAIFEGGRRTLARWRGRPDPGPADSARLMPISYGVVGLLILMTLILVTADIINPIQL